MRKRIVHFLLVVIAFCLFLSIDVEAASRTTVYNQGGWKVYLDSPDTAKSYYHLHFYKSGKHIYCLRLDNFRYCDGKSSGKNKVPQKVMSNSKVKKAALKHNPSAKKSSIFKKVLKIGAVTISAILIIVAAFNIFTGPADDAVAWAAFLKALAW